MLIHTHNLGRLFVVKRPRPHPWLVEDLSTLRQKSVTDIVCLLPVPDAKSLGLEFEEREARLIGIDFHRLPIEDYSVPHSHLAWLDAITPLLHKLRRGHHLAVHCRASIGRATLFAASLLVCEGVSSVDALQRVETVRGIKVPDTEEQVQWIHQLEVVLKTHRPQLVIREESREY